MLINLLPAMKLLPPNNHPSYDLSATIDGREEERRHAAAGPLSQNRRKQGRGTPLLLLTLDGEEITTDTDRYCSDHIEHGRGSRLHHPPLPRRSTTHRKGRAGDAQCRLLLLPLLAASSPELPWPFVACRKRKLQHLRCTVGRLPSTSTAAALHLGCRRRKVGTTTA